MKKLIGLVLVFFLVAVVAPVQSEEKVVPVTLNVMIGGGIFLEVLPNAVTWTIGVGEAKGFVVSDTGLLSYRLSWNFPVSSNLKLYQMSLTNLVYEVNATELFIEEYVKQTFSGGILTYSGMLASQSGISGAGQVIGSLPGLIGTDSGEIELMFDNKEDLKAGILTASIAYRLYEF